VPPPALLPPSSRSNYSVPANAVVTVSASTPSSPPTTFVLGMIVGLAWIGAGCSTPSLPPAHSSNSLPECPDSPNCERVSRTYDAPPDTLYAAAKQALDQLGPTQLQLRPDAKRASAVYRVGLVFKDDVRMAVDSTDSGSRLHARSASRVGYSDLGVNARRVDRLLRAISSNL
jgi:uncharacterized protein (DUF1499 family)